MKRNNTNTHINRELDTGMGLAQVKKSLHQKRKKEKDKELDIWAGQLHQM